MNWARWSVGLSVVKLIVSGLDDLFAGLFFAIYKVYNEAPDWALNNQCQSAGFDDLTNGEISFDIVIDPLN